MEFSRITNKPIRNFLEAVQAKNWNEAKSHLAADHSFKQGGYSTTFESWWNQYVTTANQLELKSIEDSGKWIKAQFRGQEKIFKFGVEGDQLNRVEING